jgi:hypothetical protein
MIKPWKNWFFFQKDANWCTLLHFGYKFCSVKSLNIVWKNHEIMEISILHIESQLVITIQEIVKRLAKGSQVDIILLDFAKAFDKVPHARLLHKLSYYGVNHNTVTWIKSFDLLGATLMTVHLLGLKLICYLFSQFCSAVRSSCNSWLSIVPFMARNKLVSSAKSRVSECINGTYHT